MSRTPTAEDRLERLELQFSDWQAILKIRVQQCKGLQTKAVELASGKELWRLKENLGSLIWDDTRLALGDSATSERLNTMQAELFQTCNQPGEIVGAFPVGACLAEAQVFDIRFRPCLHDFRVHTLLKNSIFRRL